MFVEPNTVPWLSYALDHVHLAFWVVALGIVWRFRHVVDTWAASLGTVETKTLAVERMVMETYGITTQIRDNHLAHLSEGIKEQKNDLKEHLVVLQSIDKNIAIMAAVAERNGRHRKET
jgi:hypothetical protein